jgi:hypothetical protein
MLLLGFGLMAVAATTTARFTVFLVFLATHRLDIVEYVLLLYQIFKLVNVITVITAINGMEWNGMRCDYALGIFTPRIVWILFTCAALYTQLPPRSISAMMETSILHFCASSFCVSFLSHRAWRTASLVDLAIYLVFFAVSSVLLEDAAVVAATMAEAEFPDNVLDVAIF